MIDNEGRFHHRRCWIVSRRRKDRCRLMVVTGTSSERMRRSNIIDNRCCSISLTVNRGSTESKGTPSLFAFSIRFSNDGVCARWRKAPLRRTGQQLAHISRCVPTTYHCVISRKCPRCANVHARGAVALADLSTAEAIMCSPFIAQVLRYGQNWSVIQNGRQNGTCEHRHCLWYGSSWHSHLY